jgi:iron(III) transport system permease protein
VTLRQISPAVLGGCLLVTLGLLAEYGAFEIVQYQTFTVAIFTEFNLGFDTAAACALSLVLVLLSVAVLGGELALSGRGRSLRSGTGARRPAPRVALGRWRAPALVGLLALSGLGLGVPIGSLVYWLVRGGSTTLPPASILTDTWHTAELSAAAAALATALAVPVTALAMRHRNRLTLLIERLAYLPQALPGLVIALGLVSFSVRYALPLYQSTLELIVAYAILFLPLAVVGVRSAMAQSSQSLEEAGRSLGRRPVVVWWRVTLPLLAPGLGAAFALVFISAATELTATLLLHPTGVNTLATQFWAYTSGFSYGAAAPYAALMVAISAVPAYLLSRRMLTLVRMGQR